MLDLCRIDGGFEEGLNMARYVHSADRRATLAYIMLNNIHTNVVNVKQICTRLMYNYFHECMLHCLECILSATVYSGFVIAMY